MKPIYASTMEATIARINAEKLDWLPHPGNEALYLRADVDGIWMCRVADNERIVRQADSWITAHRAVRLEKSPAPEAVAVLHDVPQESNAVVMARAVEMVRDRRLTAEYLAAKDGYTLEECAECGATLHDHERACDDMDTALCDPCREDGLLQDEHCPTCGKENEDGISGQCEACSEAGRRVNAEEARALAAEEARADAARKLSGVEVRQIQLPALSVYAPTFPPMSPDIDTENGDDGSDDDEDNPSGFINHYTCPDCKYEWTDEWSCMCDDDCPNCGKRHISPHTSEDA